MVPTAGGFARRIQSGHGFGIVQNLKKKSKLPQSYAARARKLRSLGFGVKYDERKRGKAKAGHKAAVSRAWGRVEKYLKSEKQRFRFHKAGPRAVKRVRELVSSAQTTPGGYFSTQAQGTLRRNAEGDLEFRATGARGGRYREVIRRLDPEKLATDPRAAVRAIAGRRKPAEIKITFGGFTGEQGYDLDAFESYMAEIFIPSLMDPNVHEANYGKGTHGAPREWDPEEIADTFHVKFVYYDKPTKKRSRRKK